MKISKQMRLLQNKWAAGTGWPKRLESLAISGIRGWTGQKIEFRFPIIAICGENGSGKSTILQSAASVYSMPQGHYASDFFPDTTWDTIRNATIEYTIRQGDSNTMNSVRKPTDRWRGNPDRPERIVEYIDLARIQPVSARTGYSRLAKASVKESSASLFDDKTIVRLSEIMGKQYENGKMAITDADPNRPVPVISLSGFGKDISGFHLGAGEFTMIELLQKTNPKQSSLLLIDEVETSLHPSAQRRLIRDLAEMCRVLELQIILTTHSPYILEELPPEARAYIMTGGNQKQVVFGVSPDFAMTKMDMEIHPECDLYVEDERAKILLQEIIVKFDKDLMDRIRVVPFGSASVGQALGQMIKANKFPTPSLVFLDGDQAASPGCIILPGGDAPERVVFESLKKKQWLLLDSFVLRDFSALSDACIKAMTSSDHHEWVQLASSKIHISSETLWQAMCAAWAGNCIRQEEADNILNPIKELLALSV